jgi:hypothetical protein
VLNTRAVWVSGLLAAAGILVAIGTTYEGACRRWWFAGGLLVATLGLVVNVLPQADRLPWWERRDLKRYRVRLKAQREGWSAGHMPLASGVLLILSGPHGTPESGFLCEVHSPNAVYYGETGEPSPAEQGVAGELSLPERRSAATLHFPRDFLTEAGGTPRPSFSLARGEYHVLWFGYERSDAYGSVGQIFLANDSFIQGRGGLGLDDA